MDGQKDDSNGTELWEKVLECYCGCVRGIGKDGGEAGEERGRETYLGLSVEWRV